MISQEHPPLRERVRSLGPVSIHILAAILLFLFYGWDERFYPVFFSVPASLLLGLWFLRPAVLYMNVKQGLIITGDFRHRFPFSRLRIETEHAGDPGIYRIYLRDVETSWVGVAWESATQTTASMFVEELRELGLDFSGNDTKKAEGNQT